MNEKQRTQEQTPEIIRDEVVISPAPIEQSLESHEAVKRAAVIQVQDKESKEAKVAAFLVLNAEVSVESRALRDFLRSLVPPDQMPDFIQTMRNLPMQGDVVDRIKLAEVYANNQKLLNKVSGEVRIPYRWVYGKALSRFYRGLKEEEKIYGSLCPSCKRVQVPPKVYCGPCFVECSEFVEVPRTGVLEAFTTVYLEYPGQPRKPPYTYGYIKLDGSHTHLYHLIEGIEVDRIHTGMRVEAVWVPPEQRTGNLYDIHFFRPVQ